MGRDWKSILKGDPTDWLLKADNPSVRYLTLRDVFGLRETDPEVLKSKNAVKEYEKVSKIFKKQRPEGYWESADEPYLPKYKSTYWQIMILGQLGLDKSDNRVRRACDFIFKFQLDEGGFAQNTEAGAKRKYEHSKERALKKDLTPPLFETWVEGEIREGELSCLTGNVAAALIKLGYGSDERVMRALNWLVDVQNMDGGWLCPYWRAHIRDKHGCFMGTITPLDAFSELPKNRRTPKIRAAIEKGVEFLLMHRLFRADHHDLRIINESWLKLGFPCFSYDILRGLSVVARLGYASDDRINDALDILLKKQDEEGRWLLESTPSGRMQVDLEKKGEPSKWVTLNAIGVLREIFET